MRVKQPQKRLHRLASVEPVSCKACVGYGRLACHCHRPMYISKAGKKTPYIGRFWSGCAGAVKHGLEIMGIGLLDVANNKCMMLRAHQTIGNSALKMRNKTLVEYYISVMKRYSKKLLSITDIVVADVFFSTSTFEIGMS